MKSHRQGWCPGALRPMQSGDGLIVRLRIVNAALTPDLAHALAHGAENFGNGRIDLTSRGNLQLRGVRADALAPLQAQLDALRLIDADPEAEAVRNILASPLAGLDPEALLDIRPLVEALDVRLQNDKSLHRLPGKFLFVIDDGGRLPLPIDKVDIAFVAMRGEQTPTFGIHLGGILAGSCAPGDLCETAAWVASAFLDRRSAKDRRMRDLIHRSGVDAMMQRAPIARAPEPPVFRSPLLTLLGLHDLGSCQALGIGIAFGRLDAKALHILAEAAAAAQGELRLSPWRALFLVARHIEAGLAERLAAAGFILDDAAPLRSVAACSGRPACLHGETPSQTDAWQLAPLAQKLSAQGIALHVSGCAKGCAHQDRAPVTLIGHNGRYDLVLDGRAGDEALLQPLSLASIEELLPRLAEIGHEDRAAFARAFVTEAAR